MCTSFRQLSLVALSIACIMMPLPTQAEDHVMIASPERRAVWGSARVRQTFPSSVLERGRFIVQSAEVPVRSAPKPSAGIIAYLYRGDRLSFASPLSHAWSKVQLPDGSEGYVYSSTLQTVTESTAPLTHVKPEHAQVNAVHSAVSPPHAVSEGTHRVTSPILRLRMDARATSYELAKLALGDIVTVRYFLSNGWAQVETSKGNGYVFARFLEPVFK